MHKIDYFQISMVLDELDELVYCNAQWKSNEREDNQRFQNRKEKMSFPFVVRKHKIGVFVICSRSKEKRSLMQFYQKE